MWFVKSLFDDCRANTILLYKNILRVVCFDEDVKNRGYVLAVCCGCVWFLEDAARPSVIISLSNQFILFLYVRVVVVVMIYPDNGIPAAKKKKKTVRFHYGF